MSNNKFLSVLSAIGRDFQKGLDVILPVAAAATPFVALADPALGPAFATVVGVVAQTEQKFAALGKQDGTGPQKMQEAAAILTPVIQQAFAAAGKQNDAATVQAYINAVVVLLNAIPVSTHPAATTPAA